MKVHIPTIVYFDLEFNVITEKHIQDTVKHNIVPHNVSATIIFGLRQSGRIAASVPLNIPYAIAPKEAPYINASIIDLGRPILIPIPVKVQAVTANFKFVSVKLGYTRLVEKKIQIKSKIISKQIAIFALMSGYDTSIYYILYILSRNMKM